MFRTERKEKNLLKKWNKNKDDVFDEDIICCLWKNDRITVDGISVRGIPIGKQKPTCGRMGEFSSQQCILFDVAKEK